MTRLAKLLQPLAVVGALTMIPLTTSSLAAADAGTMKELDTFMDVFNQVRANYVDTVDDHVLVVSGIMVSAPTTINGWSNLARRVMNQFLAWGWPTLAAIGVNGQ